MPVSSDPSSWKDSKLPIPGRRTWKKTKERMETIWPPSLEIALLEALERYRPSNSLRDTRLLQRFPKRNRYVSDHIFSVTGIRRTAKQVGSRLQQMRDTCNDERILNLLSRREYSPEGLEPNTPLEFPPPIEFAPSSTASSPVSWTSGVTDTVNWRTSPAAEVPPRTFVVIELVQPSSFFNSKNSCPAVKSPRANQQRVSLEYPSDIESTDPVLTYSTPRRMSTLHHYSHFRVLIDGVLAHSEITALVFTSCIPARHTYSTKLIPQFWAHLCRTEQLFRCVIKQDIMKTRAAFDGAPTSLGPTDQSIRSITYEFSALPSPAPAPVFYPPALRSEPTLPPGFPNGVGYPAQFPTPIVECPTIRNYSPPTKFLVDEAAYGWDFVTPPTDDLFYSTTGINPESYGLPYPQSSHGGQSTAIYRFPVYSHL
ncbi:hypothetical protein DFH09DRAFT_434287 [Mycena vulgaris]|nr:hypothetical protein DFH09DRAFT_434287 [Mycena vulgaris]